MNSKKVCEYSRSRSFHDDLILQDQASGERSQDQWSSGQLYVAFFEILQLSMHISNLNGGYKPRLRYSTSILTWTGPDEKIATSFPAKVACKMCSLQMKHFSAKSS